VQQGLKTRIFNGGISAAGIASLLYSVHKLYLDPVRLDWTLTFAFGILVGWRAKVWIPGLRSRVSLTDTVIYVGALMLSPWAAVILASLDALANNARSSKSVSILNLGANMSAMNLAILAAAWISTAVFGPLPVLVNDGHNLALALGMIGGLNYLFNTALRSISLAFTKRTSVKKVWMDQFLWTAPTFLIAALSAGIIARAIAYFGFYSFAVSVPVLVFTYLACKTYIGKVESSHDHIEKLTRLHLATIESLTMAIDAKDPAARGHIQRVRLLAEGLARAIDYPDEQMEGLKAAALLHDIGKLAVPEYILSKPGRLTSAEYSKVTVHPVVAADILSNVEFPYEVVPIVKHHHEKYDGTGYPSGLAGKQIPLGARILTIVDCYEALTTRRSYRPPFSREEALEMMQQESGRTFDPEILNTFIEAIESIENSLPAISEMPVLLEGVGFKAIEPDSVRGFGLAAATPTEKALLDISAAQREVLSLYEISQTLGSTLKLAEILAIIGAKLENVTGFTTLAIFLLEADRLRAAHVIGKNSERLRGIEMAIGEGGAGWAAEHRQTLLGGSPRVDLEPALGPLASPYRNSTILPLCYRGELVGTLALYCEEDPGHSADEVRMLEAIALHAAAAVHNARTFERTRESALTDALTTLPNSRYMYSFFDQERSRAERHGYPLVLMMMDLDGFKKVNDTYGHHIGDEILRRVASLARNQLRSGDTLIRYAGDEFVAVLHRATPITIAELKTRLQNTIDTFAHEVRPGKLARVGISIGHATYGPDGSAIDELMEVADQRMYSDKLARTRGPMPVTFAGHQIGPGMI